MVRTRNQRKGKIPRKGVTGSTSQYTGTGKSSSPLCVDDESPPTVATNPVLISRVPFGEPQEQSNTSPGNPNLPLASHDEQPDSMPIAADFGDNRIVDPNDLVVQLRFAINRGWEPDLSSYVSSEEEINSREPEAEEHEEPLNQEANHSPTPHTEEHTPTIESPIPTSRVNENPRKRKKPDPYEGADPRAKRPNDFPIRAGPPQRQPNIPPKPSKTKKSKRTPTEDEQDWTPNEDNDTPGDERVRTRAQKNSQLSTNEKEKQKTKTTTKRDKLSSKEKGKQKVVTNADMSNLPKPHSTTILRKEAVSLWKRIVERKIISQKLLIIDKLDNPEQIQEILITNQLLGTVTNIEPYDEQVIQEFYCNLTKTISTPSSPLYGKVYVRGNFYDFRPDIINRYLGTPEAEQNMEINSEQVAQELTAGNVIFEKNKIKAASLTSKYAILQKIALANWMPSLHESTVKWTLAELLYKIGKGVKLNMGVIIYSQITNLAEDTKSNTSIFPNLIFGILTKQSLKTHGPKTIVKNFNTTVKLRKGNHQNDLRTSAPKNNPLDSKTLITYFEGRLTELEISEKQILRKHMDIKEERAEISEWLTILKADNEEDHEEDQGSEEESQEHSQEKGVETPVSTSNSENRP
ncbi:PREDICTED: uncharacterized protein LOC109188742 [Ipomoea nil]|uniref:uncharacterized protein LOC109188742 n=1 Tax=Ipomoea nil TaxID=35883 RepID=UPI000900F7C7|nr:PREDICTED: uncharacterized protein LOC109188742 [Ipomoea nil]